MNAFLELAHPLHSEITAPMVGLSFELKKVSLVKRSAGGSCAKESATCIDAGKCVARPITVTLKP